jgi:hypothetical protein
MNVDPTTAVRTLPKVSDASTHEALLTVAGRR